MTIYSDSRYANTKVYFINGIYSSSIRKPLGKIDYDDNILHSVIEGDKLDIIAYNYWKRPDLYYVICDWNNILDPTESLNIGSILTLPSYTRILEANL